MFYTYFFNRRWTFEAVGKADKHVQIRRFFTISLIGLALQNFLLSMFLRVLPGQLAICSVTSTFFSTIWNFVGQRLYAFQDRRK
jgi:putative flippase GtrA